MAAVDILTDAKWLCISRTRMRSDDGDAAGGDVKLLKVRQVGEKGEFGGFIGESFPVRVQVELGNGEEKELRFFVKTLPSDCPAHIDMAKNAFRKEVTLYKELFPFMRELPSPAEDPKQRDFERWGPRAFFTSSDLIVMEDLVVQGFVEIDRRKPFDFDHVVLALEALARFHASAWLLERERGPEEGQSKPFDELFPECARESLFVEKPTDTLTRWFGGAVRGVQKAVRLIPKYQSSPDLEEIVNSFPKIYSLMEQLSTKSKKYRNVLNHGDLWSNNILFRYDKDGESNTPTAVRLLDYQLARYTPPAGDINNLVYLTTRLQLRNERAGDMLRRYYDSLRNAMTRGGADVEDYVTWDELVAQCDEYRPIGLVSAACYHHMNLITPDKIKDQLSPENFENFLFEEREEVVIECFRDDEYYREKVGEEITELVDTVFLGKGTDFWKRAVQGSIEKKET